MTRRMRVCAALAACWVSGALAQSTQATVDFAPAPNGYTSFSMPSGNVECIFTPAGGSKVYQPLDGGPELSCDRLQPTYVRLTMTPKRVDRADNPGEQTCCGVDNPLAYGQRWVKAGFTCDSTQEGLLCRRADGRGFFISRAKISAF